MAASKPRNRLLLALIIAASTACSLWYASAELNNKNWDEGHSLRNVRSILRTESWRPSNPFYPALSHLPQAALLSVSQKLHRATGIESFQVLMPNGNFTGTAYLVCRSTSAAYGIGALLLTFWLGRRMFSEETGLLATAVLGISPFFLKSSGIYKPDMLLMLTALAAFYFALRAAEDGRAESYLLAGVTIGASAAGKQNGAFASIPLVIATTLGFREPKRWIWLAGAALVSVVVFLAFNPWLELVPSYLRMAERYVNWTQGVKSPAPHLVVYAAGLLFEWSWHGLVLGAAAWAGLIGLAVVAFVERRRWPEEAGATLLVLFVLLFPLACAVVSTYPKANIFIATLPFTSLAAAWTLLEGGRWVLGHSSRSVGYSIVSLAAAILVASTVPPYVTYLYGVAVPETRRAASRWIERDAGFLAQRTIVAEGLVLGVGHKPWNRRPTIPLELAPERMSDLPRLELDLADYEVFLQTALEGEASEFYRGRIEWLSEAGGGAVRVFDSRAFRRRGPGIIVLAHPWRLYRRNGEDGVAAPVEWSRRGKRRLVGSLSRRINPGQVLSLELGLTPKQASECRLRIDGVDTAIHLNRKDAEPALYMTQRFVARRRSAPVRIDCPDRELFEPEPTVAAFRWVFDRPRVTGD